MKNSPVLLSFVKQRARQLKKEKSLSHSQALDESAKELGYSNYRNYLNLLEAENNKPCSDRNFALRKLSAENDMSKKARLAMRFIQNPEASFQDLFDILKLFQNSKKHVQLICEKSNLINEIHQYWLNYFLSDEGELEIDSWFEYYVAKDISLNSLCYGIDGDMICVDGVYDLIIKFWPELEDEKYREIYPHFQDALMSGTFEITIDKNKIITEIDSTLGA